MCEHRANLSLAPEMLTDRGHEAGEAGRWADDLQDGTLQGLAAMKVLLETARHQGSPQTLERAAEACLHQIDAEIGTLRTSISEMRSRAA